MVVLDPRDSAAVAGAVTEWATDRFGGPVEQVVASRSVGAGFDSYIHLIHLRGPALPGEWQAPLVLRILPSVEREPQASAEAAAQGWAADRGYPVPRVLAVLAPDELLGLPAQLMERAPGVTMLDALKAAPWRARSLVDRLAALQLRLHGLDTAGWPASSAPGAVAEARLALPRRAVAILDDAALRDALERAEAIVARGIDGDHRVVCHGDFHPLNVLVDGEDAAVIDWTDAGLGPREADVARTALLFRVAALAASSRVERAALRAVGPRLARRYLRAYRLGAPVEASRMRRWEALHCLHGWAQVEMLHAGAFEGESSAAGSERRVPRELAVWLQRRFDEAIG